LSQLRKVQRTLACGTIEEISRTENTGEQFGTSQGSSRTVMSKKKKKMMKKKKKKKMMMMKKKKKICVFQNYCVFLHRMDYGSQCFAK